MHLQFHKTVFFSMALMTHWLADCPDPKKQVGPIELSKISTVIQQSYLLCLHCCNNNMSSYIYNLHMNIGTDESKRCSSLGSLLLEFAK